jgi:hypothetical protein
MTILRCFWFLLFSLGSVCSAVAAEPTGEQIYKKRCASCHGDSGEGTKKYKKPLVGEKSVPQLATLIAKTMPEDDPGTCVGPEAEKVAAYIHDAFYSQAARERNTPPRVELARLTVKQYRNAVSDVIGTFRPSGKPEMKPGLRGEYFASRNFQGNKRIIDRIDPEVKFDFGKGTPGPEKFEPYEYSIRWEGSVLTPETGEYEFIVRTEHALRLWVNNNRVPLIDAWVKSGHDTEYRGSLFLGAGRLHSLRLEFTKSQQGVNDPKRAKEKPPTNGSIALLWKLPQREPEVIPASNLFLAKAPDVYFPGNAFPPDDRSLGWERGTTVSKAWEQATTDGAIDAAGYVSANLNELAGAKDGGADRATKLKDFARRFVERAFRRPLTDDEKRVYVDHQFEAAKEPEAAIKRVVLLSLKSPRFLYREAASGTGYAVASRLSFGLWDSIPDDELLKAAAAGKLSTYDEIAKQAERMLGDPRAKVKLRDFLHTWLKIDQPRDLTKDAKRFPGFDATVISDLRTSLDLFLDEVVWSDASDFRRLLLDESVYLNGRLSQFYGLRTSKKDDDVRAALALLLPAKFPIPPFDKPFQRVDFPSGERAGILTHPYMLSAYAYTGSTSPIHRGVFIGRGVLGIGLKPPPDAFTPLPEDLHPNLTTRERVILQTKPAACQSCHSVMNPLGFALERFDAVGRVRDKENGKAIDTSGLYETRKGEIVKFDGPRDLAKFLAGSEEVHSAFAEQMFHQLVQQPVRAYGPSTLADLRESFGKNNFNIRKLATEVMVRAALPPTEAKPVGKPPGG